MKLRKSLRRNWETDTVRFYDPPKLNPLFNATNDAIAMQIWMDKQNGIKEKGLVTNRLDKNKQFTLSSK